MKLAKQLRTLTILFGLLPFIFVEAFADNFSPPVDKTPLLKADVKAGAAAIEDEGEQVVDLYKSMPKSAPKESIAVKGVVVGIRSTPETEIFLIGARSSVIIPKGRTHNQILNKAVQSQRSGTEVSFTVDPKTMRIIEDAANSPADKSGQ